MTRRIGQPALAGVPAGQPPALGRDDLDAAPLQGGQVVAHRRVLPHLGVHGRADQHRRPGGQQRGARGGRRRARRRSGRGCAPSPARPRRGRPAGPSRVCGIGEASSHSDRCTGSEARAEKVTAPTKRVASSVRTGTSRARRRRPAAGTPRPPCRPRCRRRRRGRRVGGGSWSAFTGGSSVPGSPAIGAARRACPPSA